MGLLKRLLSMNAVKKMGIGIAGAALLALGAGAANMDEAEFKSAFCGTTLPPKPAPTPDPELEKMLEETVLDR